MSKGTTLGQFRMLNHLHPSSASVWVLDGLLGPKDHLILPKKQQDYQVALKHSKLPAHGFIWFDSICWEIRKYTEGCWDWTHYLMHPKGEPHSLEHQLLFFWAAYRLQLCSHPPHVLFGQLHRCKLDLHSQSRPHQSSFSLNQEKKKKKKRRVLQVLYYLADESGIQHPVRRNLKRFVFLSGSFPHPGYPVHTLLQPTQHIFKSSVRTNRYNI